MLLAGGFAWRDQERSTMYASAPNELHPDNSWVVSGFVETGSNVLYAWATCLKV